MIVPALIVLILAAADPTGGVWTNPIIVGLVVGFPTVLLGFLALPRVKKRDAVAAATEGDATQRVIVDLARQLAECNAELKRPPS